jgi:D-alanine transaminase
MIYLNGEWMPIEEAKIPVLDRGFIFGDGIYEVIPVYRRKPFRGEGHMQRLARSLAAVEIPNPYPEARWMELIAEIIARQPFENQAVYFQVTRGVAKRDHAFPKESTPTVFMMSNPLATPSDETFARGVACVTATDNRWLRCDIKSTSLLGNVLARQAAVDAGAAECVMFRDDRLTECSSSNFWVVRDGSVLAPPKDNLILEGIRYGLMQELCETEGVPFEVRPVTRAEVLSADELMLSSATKEVLPVTLLDGRPVGDGAPGPVFRRLHAAYQRAKAASAASAGHAAR